jgi:AraC-like DNA-binding protein
LLAASLLAYGIFAYIRRIKRQNKELWSDSETMVKMQRYIKTEIKLTEPEFVQLDKALVGKATQIVEDNITISKFGVTELAQAMHMSRSTLTRKLKLITGLTPFDFIHLIKMRYAHMLLQDKDRNVGEVAVTLGYFNRKYFTACFKKDFGMTPNEYKKSLTES